VAYLTFAAFSTGHASVSDITETVFDAQLPIASSLIEQITGWPSGTFELSSSESHYLDSQKGGRFLYCPKPPVTVTALELVTTRGTLTVAEVLSTVDDSTYVPKIRRYPEDRRLTRIEAFPRSRRFSEGQESYKVTGTFGFVDGSGNTPQEIQDVLRRLIRLLVDAESDGDEWRRGFVTKFKTDNFSYEIGGGESSVVGLKAGTLTGRPDIDGVLAMFRRSAPLGRVAARSPAEKSGPTSPARLVTY